MAEIQRAPDGNDDNEFWKVCCLSIFCLSAVHLKVLFPPLSSWHKKRHQSKFLASLNFLRRCLTKSLAYRQPTVLSEDLHLVFYFDDQSAKRINELLASL